MRGIMADVRLPNQCHAHTPRATMNGENLHMAGCLLGPRRTSTTNHYVHLDDATLSHATGRMTKTIGQELGYSQQHDSVRFSGDASLGKR